MCYVVVHAFPSHTQRCIIAEPGCSKSNMLSSTAYTTYAQQQHVDSMLWALVYMMTASWGGGCSHLRSPAHERPMAWPDKKPYIPTVKSLSKIIHITSPSSWRLKRKTRQVGKQDPTAIDQNNDDDHTQQHRCLAGSIDNIHTRARS